MKIACFAIAALLACGCDKGATIPAKAAAPPKPSARVESGVVLAPNETLVAPPEAPIPPAAPAHGQSAPAPKPAPEPAPVAKHRATPAAIPQYTQAEQARRNSCVNCAIV